MKNDIIISDITHNYQNGVHRVNAIVDEKHIWFESSDIVLGANPEAYACAFLIPAMASRKDLNIDGALNPYWMAQSLI